jgi:hypothetical protein
MAFDSGKTAMIIITKGMLRPVFTINPMTRFIAGALHIPSGLVIYKMMPTVVPIRIANSDANPTM